MSTTSLSPVPRRAAVIRALATIALTTAGFTASASSAGAAPAPSEPGATLSSVESARAQGDRPADPGVWCRCFLPDLGELALEDRAATRYPEKAHWLIGPWRAAV